MNTTDRTLAAVAARQQQVFSRKQAVSAGLSRSAIRRRLRSGLFVTVGTHCLQFAGAELAWRGELTAGLLDLGDDALVAGRAAGALYGLDGFTEGPLEFRVPVSSRGRTTLGLVHAGPLLEPIDRGMVDGFRCTGPAPTLLQLAQTAGRDEVQAALDSAVRLGLLSPDFLRRRLDALRNRGVAGVTLLDELLVDGGVESWLERRFLQLVRAAGLPEPERQRIYRREGRHVARVDFSFPGTSVVAEVGGKKGYLTTAERQRQEARRNRLQLRGTIVYFFAREDVVDTPQEVVRVLRTALGRAA
jgi:hypothetical protein